jgi:hypothetical protein
VNTGARELTYLRNLNLINPTGFLADGRPVYSSTQSAATRLDPRFNNITLQDVGAITDYNALIVNYNHRWSQGFQVSASYTWSHSISDAPDANSFEQNLNIQDATNLKRDRGASASNRPHALTLSAVVEPHVAGGNAVIRRLLNDNNFAILGNFSSGDQFNITAGRSINGDSSAASVTRPIFVGRNSYRGANIYQMDVRYTRTIASLWERVKPQFLFEVSNIFNHPNYTAYNTAVRTNASGQPVDANNNVIPLPTSFTPTASTVLEGRLVQFGLAVRF